MSSWVYSKPGLLLSLLLSVWLYGAPVLAKDVPQLKGRVNDNAGMLSDSTVVLLENVLADLEATDSTQIVLLLIDSLAGDSLENFSLRVAESWGIGQKNTDNGALLLISRDDRKLRIEVGYGLEGTLTDMVSGKIIRDIITPQFKQGFFNQGVIDGVSAMVAAVKGEYQAPPDRSRTYAKKAERDGLITTLIFVSFFFGSMFKKNKALAAGIGGIAAPLLGFLFFGLSGFVLLALIPVGTIGGLLASAIASSFGTHRGGRTGGFYTGAGGGFGRSSGSSGGFSGGGGGFGGGGASGGW